MKSYKARLKLIDDAILEKKGQWDSEGGYMVISTGCNNAWGKGKLHYVSDMRAVKLAAPYWEYVCSKEEFMQRLQKLQDKPSWDSAPRWANWLAQDSNGEWYWYKGKPTVDNDCKEWDSEQIAHPDGKGEVFGDWRDTLEERPYALGGVETVNSSKSLSWDDLFIHTDARHTINAEHTDIIMPDGTKVRLLDLLLEHNAVKRYKLEQEVAQVIDDNYGRDALSVARAVLKTLEEKNNER